MIGELTHQIEKGKWKHFAEVRIAIMEEMSKGNEPYDKVKEAIKITKGTLKTKLRKILEKLGEVETKW